MSATRLGQFSWCLYDWANSAFPTVVTTFVFAAYFAKAVATDPTSGTAQWGHAISLGGFVVALGSPLLGAIADQTGRRKPWLGIFSLLSILASAGLWWVTPEPASVPLALLLVALATAAFDLGTVFYNAMLPGLTSPERIGRLSGYGWGLGYAGGLLCLLLGLYGLVQPDPPLLPLARDSMEHVRATGPLVALWFALFALPLFLFTPDLPATGVPIGQAARAGLGQLWGTLRHHLPQHPEILRFLLARLLYNEGLNSLFAFGGLYAAGVFGMTVPEVMQFGIAINVTAGVGALAFGWLDDRFGSRRVILWSLAALVVLSLGLVLGDSKAIFWPLGLLLGIFVGPAQASSRAYMAHLAPPALRNEMFGLFALSGKATAFLGPLLVGAVTLAFDSQRAGMGVVVVLLMAGGLLLYGKHPRD